MDSARWRTARLLLLVCGAALLAILVWRNDPEAILHSIRQLGWRILIVIAFPFTVVNILDTLGWRFAFRRDRVPFGALFSARLAGEAFNLTTPTASVGGEAVKAWLIRHHAPLEEAAVGDRCQDHDHDRPGPPADRGSALRLGAVATRL